MGQWQMVRWQTTAEKQEADVLSFTDLDQPLPSITDPCFAVVEVPPNGAVFETNLFLIVRLHIYSHGLYGKSSGEWLGWLGLF